MTHHAKHGYENFYQKAITWLREQPQEKLSSLFTECLDYENAVSINEISIFFRRIIHFDTTVRDWIEKGYHNNVSLPRLADIKMKEYNKQKIPRILQHLLCLEQRKLFQNALEICLQHEIEKKQDFKSLTDWIETSDIKISETELRETPREKLPAGINATATKKYINWIKQDSKKLDVFQNHARQFWLEHKSDLKLWNNIWADPLTITQLESSKFQIIPADLRASILIAKLQGAIAIFPHSGLYVAHWSSEKEQDGDWNLGLYSLIPRLAQEYLVGWKGKIHTLQEIPKDQKSFIEQRKSRYRQSFPYQASQLFIDVTDEEGKELGFNMKEEWIAHFTNEPFPQSTSNSFTVLAAPKDKTYISSDSIPLHQVSQIPTVEIYTCCELIANQEIYINYFRTHISSKENNVNIKEVKYAIGDTFQDTRRRIHLFLPGGKLREWIQNPDNQNKLAEFTKSRLFQYYIDDFFWRTFSTASPFSHVFKKE